MNIQELNKYRQSNGISIWQVHDYANALLDAVVGMQYDQAPPAEASELIDHLNPTDHPMQIGKLFQVLKELKKELLILTDQTRQTEQAIDAWNVPEDWESKLAYDVRYPLPASKEEAENWFKSAHPTIVNPTGKYITYASGSSDYPSGYGYDS